MVATLVYLSDIGTAVETVLTGAGGFPAADVYDGKVIDKPSVIAGTQMIQPYAVFWIAPGDNSELPLGGPDGGAETRLYITVAASTPGKTLDAYDRVRRLLDGTSLLVSGHLIGVRWLNGYFAPPPQRDPDVSPDRWFIPLIFTALI